MRRHHLKRPAGELRLPTFNHLRQGFAQRADKEGWTAARFLVTLAEHELAERDRRRIERHLREAKLLPGKSLESFDFNAVPMISKAQVNALAAGDAWLTQGANCLVFGPPSPSTQCTPRYVIEGSAVPGSDLLFVGYRRRAALEKTKRKAGRPASYATGKNTKE